VARLAIDALARGQRTIVPNFAGRILALLVRFLPVGWITALVEKAARPTGD
jgi:short-subunit dehydrogenase